ncbi:AtpZ/AtpI family protein [Patescibacteria group bacterium]
MPSKHQNWMLAINFLTIGLDIVLPVAGAAWLGNFLDRKYSTSPWILISLIVLAIFISSWLVYKQFKKIQKINE